MIEAVKVKFRKCNDMGFIDEYLLIEIIDNTDGLADSEGDIVQKLNEFIKIPLQYNIVSEISFLRRLSKKNIDELMVTLTNCVTTLVNSILKAGRSEK